LAKIAKSFDRQPPHSSYLRLITPDLQEKGIRDLSSREGQEDINEYLDDVDLVVLDNLSCLIRTGSENEAESWAPVQEWILALRRAGKAVIFLHHAGKNGQQRGTSKKEDVLDTTIVLKRPNNYLQSNGAKFEIHFQKSRGFEGEKAKPIEASLISRDDGAQQWIFSELEGRDQTRVLELKSEGLTQREIAQELNVSASTVNRWIKEAESGNLRRVK